MYVFRKVPYSVVGEISSYLSVRDLISFSIAVQNVPCVSEYVLKLRARDLSTRCDDTSVVNNRDYAYVRSSLTKISSTLAVLCYHLEKRYHERYSTFADLGIPMKLPIFQIWHSAVTLTNNMSLALRGTHACVCQCGLCFISDQMYHLASADKSLSIPILPVFALTGRSPLVYVGDIMGNTITSTRLDEFNTLIPNGRFRLLDDVIRSPNSEDRFVHRYPYKFSRSNPRRNGLNK